MKCDKGGCTNLTCNIYDTDLNGECRVYNTIAKPDEPITTAPVQNPTTVDEKIKETTSVQPAVTTVATNIKGENHQIEENPIELEAVMSSTISEQIVANKPQKVKPVKPESSPQNKVK